MISLIDPRVYIIKERLSSIKTIIPILGFKGGVGKTTIASLLALSLSEHGYRVGLIDMDFTNPTLHIVLGVNIEIIKPIEEKGIIPPRTDNLRLITLAYYTKGNPTPLRGRELDEVFKEILSITIWRDTDILIVDPPPTFTDVNLNIIRFMKDLAKPLIVSNTSILSIQPTRNLVRVLRELSIEPIGLIFNMSIGDKDLEERLLSELRNENIRVLGILRLDTSLEKAYGSISLLKQTSLYRDIHSKIALNIVEYL
ncbi:MAG: P-loop NTPase [Acidilobaceae archaeon]